MTFSVLGHFDGKVIVPEEPIDLPAGQRLRVEIETLGGDSPRFADLLKFAAEVPDPPSDLAAQHDHYLYGTAKR